MTFDQMLDAFGGYDVVPVQAIEQALADWSECGPRFRGLLHAYVHGEDVTERTERSLYVIVHLLAEKADTAAFADLCLLAGQVDRFDSVYGPVGAIHSFARVTVSTFDGNPAPLERLIGHDELDGYTRCDALLTLAYLACTDRISERYIYAYLSQLAPSLPDYQSDLWYGYARSVAALGFAGLTGAVDAAFKQGNVPEDSYTQADFWLDLRETQAGGRDVSGPAWADVQPIGSAVDQLFFLDQVDQPAGFDGLADGAGYEPPQPIRNPLRDVGRNDPCPCGSGKKYKKCCLQGGAL